MHTYSTPRSPREYPHDNIRYLNVVNQVHHTDSSERGKEGKEGRGYEGMTQSYSHSPIRSKPSSTEGSFPEQGIAIAGHSAMTT